MTMCYGSFLLRHFPAEAVETEAQCLDALERFASLGFCPVFREIIKERVVEFRYDVQTRLTSYRWLEGADADLVLQLNRLGNCVPASWLETVTGLGPVLVPKVLRGGSISSGQDTSLKLETGNVIRFSASGSNSALERIRYVKKQVMQASEAEFEAHHDPRDSRELLVEFYDELLSGITRCKETEVVYILCEF